MFRNIPVKGVLPETSWCVCPQCKKATIFVPQKGIDMNLQMQIDSQNLHDEFELQVPLRCQLCNVNIFISFKISKIYVAEIDLSAYQPPSKEQILIKSRIAERCAEVDSVLKKQHIGTPEDA